VPTNDEVSGDPGNEISRRDLFRAAAIATGRRCDTALSIYAFRPSPTDPAVLERALVKGLIGSVAKPGGMPFVMSSGNTAAEGAQAPTTLDRGAEIRARAPEAILRPFTSDPFPSITTRGSGANVFQVFDSHAAAGQPFDVVTALRADAPMIDPSTGRSTLTSVWSLVSCPAERLVLDVYLHQQIERRFRPGLDCLLWNVDLDLPAERRWSIRVPGAPRLELLGRGTGQAACVSYARHAELTDYLFEHIGCGDGGGGGGGWDAREYIGFRCEVRFPVWRAGYCMTFDEVGE
jgi:hypothetical protein